MDWLRNDRGNRNCLELDGYNEELSIAFEYDGGQHEQRVEAWQDENEFEELQRKDRLKDALCREKGIALIRIGHEVKTDEIEAHVTAEIRRNGLGHVIVGTVDNSNYISIVQDEFLSEARKYAEEHGGECRSELILTTSDPVIFYCPIHDHDWHVSLSALRSRPTWCLHCSHAAIGERNKKRAKQDFEARIGKGKEPLDKMATNFSGYKCHSDIPVDEYIDRETEYQWECPDEAHPPFPLSYKKAQQAHKRGQPHICPKCNKKERITIEQMHDFAKNNGGTCLTKKLDKAGDSVVEFKCKAKEHKMKRERHKKATAEKRAEVREVLHMEQWRRQQFHAVKIPIRIEGGTQAQTEAIGNTGAAVEIIPECEITLEARRGKINVKGALKKQGHHHIAKM
mgnify:CR=1 FL=1